MTGDGLSGLVHERCTGVESIVFGVDNADGVVAAIEDKEPLQIGGLHGKNRALAHRDRRIGGIAGDLNRGDNAVGTGSGREVARDRAGGSIRYILAENVVALAIQQGAPAMNTGIVAGLPAWPPEWQA